MTGLHGPIPALNREPWSGARPPPDMLAPAHSWPRPPWGSENHPTPYLVDEEDFGSHVNAHARHSSDSRVHTCERLGQHPSAEAHTGRDPGPPCVSGGTELGVRGPTAGGLARRR